MSQPITVCAWRPIVVGSVASHKAVCYRACLRIHLWISKVIIWIVVAHKAPCTVLWLVAIMTAAWEPEWQSPACLILSYWNMICYMLTITMPLWISIWIYLYIYIYRIKDVSISNLQSHKETLSLTNNPKPPPFRPHLCFPQDQGCTLISVRFSFRNHVSDNPDHSRFQTYRIEKTSQFHWHLLHTSHVKMIERE